MKSKDIIKQYGLEQYEFENYIRRKSSINYKDGIGGIVVADSDVDTLISNYKQYLVYEAEKRAAAEKAEAEKADAEKKAAEEKQAAMARMLITSGFNFDGYTITKYSGYISGDDAVSIPRNTGFFQTSVNVGDELLKSLTIIRRNALAELKEAAYALGCNAVIGVDFDYLTLDPETAHAGGGTLYLPYVFCVTANGNAVIIEKNKTV